MVLPADGMTNLQERLPLQMSSTVHAQDVFIGCVYKHSFLSECCTSYITHPLTLLGSIVKVVKLTKRQYHYVISFLLLLLSKLILSNGIYHLHTVIVFIYMPIQRWLLRSGYWQLCIKICKAMVFSILKFPEIGIVVMNKAHRDYDNTDFATL